MTRPPTRELFLNLPVGDLPRARAFFGALGFDFEARFSNDDAACMIVGPEAYVMLLRRPFFETFTSRPLGDPARAVHGLYAFSAPSRAAVDRTMEAAIAAGGEEARDAIDQGYMYGRSFYDLDGHQWEVLWMGVGAAGAQA